MFRTSLNKGGGGIYKHTGRYECQFSNDKRRVNLAYFVQMRIKKNIKLLNLKSTSILNISALYFLNKSAVTHSLVGTVPSLKAKHEG